MLRPCRILHALRNRLGLHALGFGEGTGRELIMYIIILIVTIGAFSVMAPAVSLAQQDVIAQQDMFAKTRNLPAEPTVNVSFGAVMMQVPVSLAIQLCPGIDADAMPARFADTGGVACAIPHEAYTSHSTASELTAR